MYEMNTDGAFSHRRRHSLYVSRPHVAHRKHSREAGLQHFGRTIERPPRVAIASRIEVAARQNEAFLIEGYAALQPFGSRRSARHDKQVPDGMPLSVAKSSWGYQISSLRCEAADVPWR
jgi:hypothetical protein